MNIIITGATGIVGTAVLKEAMADSQVSNIVTVTRSPVLFKHPKLTALRHDNYRDYSPLKQVFKQSDACIWCLGASQQELTAHDYNIVCHDYAIAAATDMLEANPEISMLFINTAATGPAGQPRQWLHAAKDKTEQALLNLPFQKLMIAHMHGIKHRGHNNDGTFTLQLQYSLMRLFRYMSPKQSITNNQLGIAMLTAIKGGLTDTLTSYNDRMRKNEHTPPPDQA